MEKQSNQFDLDEKEPHASVSAGVKITMPDAGVTHGGEVHYDQETRSDSNKGV